MRWTTLSAALLVFSTACSIDHPDATSPLRLASSVQASLTAEADSATLLAFGRSINTALEASGSNFRLDNAEWIGGNAAGQLVLFNDRGNRQADADFVPGDARRGGHTNIVYVVDQAEGAIDGLTVEETTAAIDRAMASWAGLKCSDLSIASVGVFPGIDLGVIEWMSGLGGLPFPVADVTHAGWLPAGLLGPNVIGVTFTFGFVEEDGVTPTDVNNDGKADVAFREILYNDLFVWGINDNSKVDVETIALHESGHGLSQLHFGKAFFTLSNGKVHFAPRAVMNAGYSGIQQKLTGTDKAGHCSNWADWPSN